MKLQDNERIDDLEYKGLKIIQNKEAFCFGIDSILLSDFAKEIKNGSKVIDLGTGNGIIGIMLCAKTELSKMIGVEVQEESAKLTKRNIELNNFEEKFEVINKNINDLEEVLQMGTFDAVVTNPPYKKVGTGMTNENEKKLIARHEIKANLEDFVRVSSKLLKDKGNFYMVHRPDRLVDIIDNLTEKTEKKIKQIEDKQKKLEAKMEEVENSVNEIESDIYLENEFTTKEKLQEINLD